MTIQELKERIIIHLKSLQLCIPYKQDTQYKVRCYSCGDSKDPTHAHLSIYIDVNNNEQMKYRCFRCPFSGYVNEEFLGGLGIYLSNEEKEALNKLNRTRGNTNYHSDKGIRQLLIPMMNEKELQISGNEKIEYLADRLGVSTDKIRENQERFRLILNPFSFVSVNEIKIIPGVSYKYMMLLHHNYIGFLSANSNVITFRNIHNDTNLKRYINITVNPKILNSNTFFKLPFRFNLLYTDTVHVRVAEGIFDILSIYMNIMKENNEGNIYFACAGFRFISIIRYLITNGINTGVIFHIYSDNDKSDEDHKEYLIKNKKYLYWIDKIIIHRNMYKDQKDFGVSKNLINEIEYELKV